jgi:hypothetical protein
VLSTAAAAWLKHTNHAPAADIVPLPTLLAMVQELQQLYEDERRVNDQLNEEMDQMKQDKDAAMAQ